MPVVIFSHPLPLEFTSQFFSSFLHFFFPPLTIFSPTCSPSQRSYRVLAIGVNKALAEKERCGEMLKKFDGKAKDWQLGLTKVFMRESLETILERRRHEELRVTVMKIQAVILGYIQRKRYKATRASIIRLQAWWKMIFYSRRFRNKKKGTIIVQSLWRG